MRTELLTSLLDRVAAVYANDHGPVLADDALAEAERLQPFVAGPDGPDLEVVQALGVFHYARARLLGEQAGYSPFAATTLLRLVYLTDPEGVPEELRPHFEAKLSAGESGRSYDMGLAVGAIAQVSGEASVFALAVDWLRASLVDRRPAHVAGLGGVLLNRYQKFDDPSDLDEALSLLQEADASLTAEDPAFVPTLAALGWAWTLADLQSPDPAAVDRSIEARRRLLQLGESVPVSLHLATMLHRRFDYTGDQAALAEEIRLLRAVPPEFDIEVQFRLASALLYTDERSAALTMVRELLSRPVDSVPGLVWHNLSLALGVVTARTGEAPTDAIETARRAIRLESDQPALSEMRANLARLLARAGQLDEALATGRLALAECPPNSATTVVQQLAVVLARRYRRFGVLAELDEAIALLRDSTTSRQHLPLLATCLRERYVHSPDLEALDEVIQIDRRMLRELSETHLDQAQIEVNLSVALTARYEHAENDADLSEAVELARAAIARTSDGHGDLPVYLMNLCNALLPVHIRDEDPAVLDELLAIGRRAVSMTPDGHPFRAPVLINLGAILVRKLEVTESPADAAEVVEVTRQAVAAAAPDDVKLAFTLVNHAIALAVTQEWSQALSAAQAATRVTAAPPSVRLRACRIWGQVAGWSNLWEEAAAGFGEGVRLLPSVAPRNLRSTDLERILATTDGVHVNAAASAIWAGDPEGALELLEQGRGILAAYALDSRTEVTDLRSAAPQLADEWERIRLALDAQNEAGPDQRHALNQRWTSTLECIRRLSGFERFLMPASIQDLMPAAAEGPVITVNASEIHCAALILTNDGAKVVPLPDLSTEDLARRVPKFLKALRLTGDLVERMEAQAHIRDTLAWLWNTVTGPILDTLGDVPRVWWSPTGLLNFLPLHAAGDALDRVISSYTPTIRALLHARSRPPAGEENLLAVAMSKAPGQAPLPRTRTEAESLARQHSATPLFDGDATHDNVIKALPTATWAHFACHAHNDPVNPGESHLLLHDRPIRVPEISRLRMPAAELAYLSACSTASGGTRIPDEAIHIVSAFQLAGYRHVVGTLWSIEDATATSVAEGFYTQLGHGMSPAEALHTVVRQLRREQPLMASAWASHIHVGP